MKSSSRARAPTTVKRTVRRGRRPNGHYRTREYLTEREVERLMKSAGRNRYGHRDATMILLAFRHGLRASELCSLRWEGTVQRIARPFGGAEDASVAA
jgi:integrase